MVDGIEPGVLVTPILRQPSSDRLRIYHVRWVRDMPWGEEMAWLDSLYSFDTTLVGTKFLSVLLWVPTAREGRRLQALHPVILCRQCGELVERGREVYAIPMCYGCLPPPPPLPLVLVRS